MANAKKQLTANQKEKLAIEIIECLQKKNMFNMVNIWVNNNKLSDDEHPGDTKASTRYGDYYIAADKNPADVVEYSNADTITMTFEGPLYHALNYGSDRTGNDLNKIFAKYGLYFEQGYAWSLAAYEN